MAENHTGAPKEVDNRVEAGSEKLTAKDFNIDMTSSAEAGKLFNPDEKTSSVVEDGKLSLDFGNLYGGDSVSKQAGKAVDGLAVPEAISFEGTTDLFGGGVSLRAGLEKAEGVQGDGSLGDRSTVPVDGVGDRPNQAGENATEAEAKIETKVEAKSPEDRSAQEKSQTKDDFARTDDYQDRKDGANDLLYWSGKEARQGNLFGEKGNLSKEDVSNMLKNGEGLSNRDRKALTHLKDNFDKIASGREDGDGVSHDDIKQYFRNSQMEGNVAVNPDKFVPGSGKEVNPSDVREGSDKWVTGPDGKTTFQPGILQSGSKEDIQKFQQWLDNKVPPDGSEATNDKRSALIVKVAMQDAAQQDDSPANQMVLAYQKLNAMRHSMRELTPGEGYSSDPGIANAEHFLETAHRVAGAPFDGNADDLSGSALRGEWSAPFWKATANIYNGLKEAGVIGGSKAEGQSKWESAGVDYGVQSHRVKEYLDSRNKSA